MPTVLNAVFQAHRRSLLWSVMKIVRDPQIAEDLAHEAYLNVRHAIEARQVEHVESFLYQTARNLALDHLRRSKVRGRYEARAITRDDIENAPSATPSPEEGLLERQQQAIYEEALRALPVRARTAWSLLQLRGWTYAEIADHLGVSRNTVYNDIKLVTGHCRDALARCQRI